MTLKTKTFDNLFQFTQYVEKAIADNRWEFVSEIKHRAGRDNFFGETTLEQTLNSAKYGLKKYTEYFLDNINEVSTEQDVYDGIFLDNQGFAYDMGAVVSGVPECCLNTGALSSTPVITIYVDMAFNAGTKARLIQNRGIAITNLVHTLIAKKYIIDIHFIDFNTQYDMDTLITIKMDSSILSAATVSFMSSPEFWRQMVWIAEDELRQKDSESGRGTAFLTDEVRHIFEDNNIFVIPGYYQDRECLEHYEEVDSANKYISKLFNQYCKQRELEV